MSNRRSLGETNAIAALARVRALIETTGSDYVSVYAVAAAIEGRGAAGDDRRPADGR